MGQILGVILLFVIEYWWVIALFIFWMILGDRVDEWERGLNKNTKAIIITIVIATLFIIFFSHGKTGN